MDRDEVRTVVRVILAVLGRIAHKTRTQADDLMTSILQANEERLVDAVILLLAHSDERPTEEQVAAALKNVGIQV